MLVCVLIDIATIKRDLMFRPTSASFESSQETKLRMDKELVHVCMTIHETLSLLI